MGKINKTTDPCVLNFLENWKNQVIVDDSSEVQIMECEQSEDDLKKCDLDDNEENKNSLQKVIINDDIGNSILNCSEK